MIITYKTAHKVEFPAFILPSADLDFSDGLVFVEGRLVDDRNVKADTVGKRRLLSSMKQELFPLKKSVVDELGLIKNKGNTAYIDNIGRIFMYEKTLMVPLKYHRIKRVERKEVASVLWLKGCKMPFVIPRPPPADACYCGVLYFQGLPWKLYEYSGERMPDTRRKI